jgi:hypothetical protein
MPSLAGLQRSVKYELNSYGFDMKVEKKQKITTSAVQSAFIKGGTLIHLIKIASVNPPVAGVSKPLVSFKRHSAQHHSF